MEQAPEKMSDDVLLDQINCFDPYDVEFAKRYRAQVARIAHLEAQVAAADALAREVERIATHKHKEMGLDYGRPHHPAYPELFRRLAVYEAKKGHTE